MDEVVNYVDGMALEVDCWRATGQPSVRANDASRSVSRADASPP